jgi:hypothetical protein
MGGLDSDSEMGTAVRVISECFSKALLHKALRGIAEHVTSESTRLSLAVCPRNLRVHSAAQTGFLRK